MERKTKDTVQELLVAEYETDGGRGITGEDLELWYREENQRNGTSQAEFDEALQEAFYKVHYRGTMK